MVFPHMPEETDISLSSKSNHLFMEKITLTIEQLSPNKEIKCNYENCTSVFTNYGNYRMHMLRHHNQTPEPSINNSQKLCCFYCPITECDYNQNSASGKCFSEMKYIRQHFQKVHSNKSLICRNSCGKTFVTARQLEQHLKKVCGRNFDCKFCCWTCKTSEALYTHLKRKHANEKTPTESTNKVAIARLKSKRIMYEKPTNISEENKQNKLNILPLQSNNFDISNNTAPAALIDFTCKVNEQAIVIAPQDHVCNKMKEIIKSQLKVENQAHDEFLKEIVLSDISTQNLWKNFESTKINNNSTVNPTTEVHLKLNCLFVNQIPNTKESEEPKKTEVVDNKNYQNSLTQTEDTTNSTKSNSNPVNIETQTCETLNGEVKKLLSEWKNIETQTDKYSIGILNNLIDENSVDKTFQNSLTQTEDAIYLPKLNTNPVHIETQTCDDLLTEVSKLACGWNAQKNIQTQTDENYLGLLNNFLVENCVDIQTQTHEDYFTELGLADIQTQTNWTSYENLTEKTDEFFVKSPRKDIKSVKQLTFDYGVTIEVDEIVTKNNNNSNNNNNDNNNNNNNSSNNNNNANSNSNSDNDNDKNETPINKAKHFQQTQTTGLFELFGQSTHCYTQTNDNFLENFNLTNMQNAENSSRKNNVSTTTSCFPEELFVSTETQTSFTQCFFDSHTSMDDVAADPDTYATQYTQTTNEQ